MAEKKRVIECCNGKYHIVMDGKFYCMKPPDIECRQACKDIGRFTRGEKKILYCEHHQHPCKKCAEMLEASKNAEGS